MIELVTAVLSASVLGLGLFFAIRGLGKFARRRWRLGFKDVGLFVGLTLLGFVMIGVIGSAIAKGGDVDPSGPARILGETSLSCGAPPRPSQGT